MRERRAPRALGFLVAAVAATGVAGCAKSQAKAVVEPVPLNAPPVPPRVIAPPAIEEAEEPQAVAPPQEATPPARRTPARQTPQRRTEGTRQEAPAAPPAETAPPPATAPLLRKPQTGDDSEATQKIKEMLTRAGRDLARANYGALNGEGKSQFDTAKRFIEQAEDALRARNFVFATYLAGKAETLARELFGQ